MRQSSHSLFVVLSVFASSAFAENPVTMQRPVPLSEDAEISGTILRECNIQVTLADFVKELATKHGIDMAFVDTLDETVSGRVLHLEIKDAVSEGNAWLGHRKSTSIRGKLLQDGVEVGDFRARRNSMGGAFAGYKGSCSVLGRTVRAVAEDVTAWLSAPVPGALLGDLK